MPFTFNPFTGTFDVTGVSAATLANYFFLPGRAGGQIGYGGVNASDNLILRSTSNATKGLLELDDAETWWPSMGNFTAAVTETRLVSRFTPTFAASPAAGVAHELHGLDISPTVTSNADPAATGFTYHALHSAPTVTMGANLFSAVVFGGGSYTATAAAQNGTWAMFTAQPTLQSTTPGVGPYNASIYQTNSNFTYNATGPATTTILRGVEVNDVVNNGSTGTYNITDWDLMIVEGNFNELGGGSVALGTARGLRVLGIAPNNIIGTFTMQNVIGVDIETLGFATNVIALRSKTTSGPSNYMFQDTGGAQSQFIGAIEQSYTPTTQTIPTGFGTSMVKRLTLTGTQRWTLAGTSRLVIL